MNLKDAIVSLDEEKCMVLLAQELKKGVLKNQIIKEAQEAMVEVGLLYENEEYYIADLMMAGIIFEKIISFEGMKTTLSNSKKKRGKVVLGTIQGDLHDIGKTIFKNLLLSENYKVYDLGIDVPPEVFCKAVEKYRPQIMGISTILTYTINDVKKTVDLLKKQNLRDDVKIIIGSGIKNFPDFIKESVDAIVSDTNEGLKICDQWIQEQ